MENEFLGFFLKFGEEDHLKSLLNEGEMYCNTVQYFANLDDNVDRGDNLENIFKLKYFGEASIKFGPVDNPGDPEQTIEMFTENLKLAQHHTKHCGNLFCLYSLKINDYPLNTIFQINDERLRLGDHVLVITNPGEFIKRVQSAVVDQNLAYRMKFVDYLDFSQYTGDRDIMQKGRDLDYQKEFRVWIDFPVQEPLKLKIGNIRDIAHIRTTQQFLNSNLLFRSRIEGDSSRYNYFVEITDPK